MNKKAVTLKHKHKSSPTDERIIFPPMFYYLVSHKEFGVIAPKLIDPPSRFGNQSENITHFFLTLPLLVLKAPLILLRLFEYSFVEYKFYFSWKGKSCFVRKHCHFFRALIVWVQGPAWPFKEAYRRKEYVCMQRMWTF